MNNYLPAGDLSFFKGLFHKLASGWIFRRCKTGKIGFILGASALGVFVVIGLLQGLGRELFSLGALGVHVRLLLSIPLFFESENIVEPLIKNFLNTIRCGLISENEMPAFSKITLFVSRVNESWIPEGVCLVFAYAMPFANFIADLPGNTSDWVIYTSQIAGPKGWTYGWYMLFCLPLYRFFLLRWLWYLGFWWYFLWRLEKLKLRLIATHSDRAAGLGYLETVTMGFTPLVSALSAILSASLAEELYLGKIDFDSVYKPILIILLLIMLVFIAPLLMFRRKLKVCRAVGLMNYGIMAFRYVDAFDHKWIRSKKPSGDSQLGTPDLQSLADLTNSINVVLDMRLLPIGKRAIQKIMIVASLPFLPLLLFRYKIPELLPLLKSLVGL
jgi:hypothetical protein